METFKRYLLHFSGIATIILLIAYILIYIDGGELHNPIFILFLAFSLQFFAFFMTLFSYSMAKIKVIEFVYESENVKELEELIMSLTHREEVKDMGTEVLYLFKNKYKAWLAGTIKLEKQDGIYKLYVPNAYAEKIIRNNKIKVTNILLA